MDRFPRNLQLVEFFGADPTVFDRNAPWVYSRLHFVTTRGPDEVRCVIDNPEVELRWRRESQELLFVHLRFVQALYIIKYPGGEALVADSTTGNGQAKLSLQLHPKVHVSYETDI
jgi:hypothetical protein